eukprot:3053589-Prymnesium_polylepis.2
MVCGRQSQVGAARWNSHRASARHAPPRACAPGMPARRVRGGLENAGLKMYGIVVTVVASRSSHGIVEHWCVGHWREWRESECGIIPVPLYVRTRYGV